MNKYANVLAIYSEWVTLLGHQLNVNELPHSVLLSIDLFCDKQTDYIRTRLNQYVMYCYTTVSIETKFRENSLTLYESAERNNNTHLFSFILLHKISSFS